MKKIVIALAIVLIPKLTFAAQCNFLCSLKTVNKLPAKIDYCIERESMSAFAEIEKILKAMKESKIDMDVEIDLKENTLLHYVLGHPLRNVLGHSKMHSYIYRELLTLVRRYVHLHDTSLQNENGYTVLMLAARYGELGTFLGLLFGTTPVNFAIKNRKDGNKTVIDYAKGMSDFEGAIRHYDETFKKNIAEKVTETSGLITDLSKLVADYATPVNPHDMEADRAYEHELWLKEMDRRWIELEVTPL